MYEDTQSPKLHVLKQRTKDPGPKHPDTILASELLANTNLRIERNEKAWELMTGLYEQRQRILGPDHHDTILAIVNLEAAYSCTNRYAEAEALKEQALRCRDKV
jgi:Tetratricopeptide repeat